MLDETPVAAGRRPRPSGLAGATVLLCGTGTHRRRRSGLSRLTAVKTTLTDLRNVLTDRCGADPRVVADPRSTDEFGDAISDAAESDRDVLLLYYVGHGLVAADGRLHLATTRTDSRPNRVKHTALAYDTIRDYVIESPARVKIVILDCCYSGRAVGRMAADADLANRVAIEGAYVLTSAARDETSIEPPGARHTAFSGKLIELLNNGDPTGDEFITLDGIFRYLDRELPAHNYPRPQRRVIGTAGEFPLTDNPAAGGRAVIPLPVPPPRRRIRVPAVLTAALVSGATVPAVASARYGGGSPARPAGVRGELVWSWWGPALLVATAALVALLVAGPMTHWLTRIAVRSRWRRIRRTPVPLLTAVSFALALLLGATALDVAAAVHAGIGTCPTTAQVSVLAPAGSHEPVREIAEAFERHTAVDNFGCPDARLLAFSAPAAEITAALARGWDADARVRIGPRPDVWLPDWSGETRQARAAATAAGRTLPIAEERTVASTPMVLAVATRSADASTAVGLIDGAAWPEQLETMRRAGWDTVAPDPDTSLGGLARVALYHPPASAGVTAPPVRTVERHIERSLDRGRHELGADAATLLCAVGGLRDRTGYLVTEQAVARFNNGDPIGPSCRRRADDRLRAVYAGHTPVLDRQAVRFAWPGGNDRRTRAVERFTGWLRSPDGHAALNAAGLRAGGAPAARPLGPEWGVQPDLSPSPAVTSMDLVEDARTRYRQEQRPGRVLIAIDASESMKRAAAEGSLWRVAAAGAQGAARLLGPQDELGVWAFQGAGSAGVRRLVPIGRPQPVTVQRALDRVRPQGPAPLYHAIADGLAEVGPTTDERVTAVVLLTDGENDNASTLDAGQFRAAVTGQGVRVFAVAMGAAGCAAPVLRTVTTATGGTCLEADDGTVTGQLTTIFEAVL